MPKIKIALTRIQEMVPELKAAALRHRDTVSSIVQASGYTPEPGFAAITAQEIIETTPLRCAHCCQDILSPVPALSAAYMARFAMEEDRLRRTLSTP